MFIVSKEWIKNNMLEGIPVSISNQNGEYFMKGYKLESFVVSEVIIELEGRVEKFPDSFCTKLFYCPDIPSNKEYSQMIREIQLENARVVIDERMFGKV